jgi:tRNA (guanine-N7-)-methyltransferase
MADAVEVCGRWIPPHSVDGVHLFFPDPWPKKRHHKRRLVRPGFPELVSALLKPDGYLYCVTDWEDYAEQMRTILESSSDLTNRYPSWAPPQAWRPTTAFERKGIDKGHTIRELIFERVR